MARLTTIDSTTRYSSVYINYHGGTPRISSITAYIDNTDDNAQVYFPNTGDVIDSAQLAILTVLREHYAEHGGFINDDGNIVNIRINEWIYGDTPESFAEFGFWNPLDANGWANYEQSLRDAGRLLQRKESSNRNSWRSYQRASSRHRANETSFQRIQHCNKS